MEYRVVDLQSPQLFETEQYGGGVTATAAQPSGQRRAFRQGDFRSLLDAASLHQSFCRAQRQIRIVRWQAWVVALQFQSMFVRPQRDLVAEIERQHQSLDLVIAIRCFPRMRRYKLIFAGENTVNGAVSRRGCACVVTKFSLPCRLDEIKAYRGAGRHSFQEAAALVQVTRDVVDVFKVGSQLFTRVGPRIIEFLHEQGKECFLDLKFHDIPNTVAKAVESAVALRVRMLTLHACGGAEMLRAAAAVPHRPLLLGVTVLTSVGGNVQAEVLRLAKLAKRCGLNGVIASPREIHPIREVMGEKFLIVTPGIRPAKSELGDQRRAMTPAEAIIAGADYIVVGRPIIAAENPAHAALKITEEIVFAAGAG